MEPVQPAAQPNTTRRYFNPPGQTGESQFSATVAAASARAEPSPEQWEPEKNAALDRYRLELHKLLDKALVDQAFANTKISILISTLAIERMRNDPEFESHMLNSLYNGMQAATYLVVPAYLLLRMRGDGTLETSSGGEETLSEYEEEAINAFWTRQPVSANLDSTESRRMTDERRPKKRRKLDRRRIRVWLERRKRQFLAKRQALYELLAGHGNRPRIDSEQEDNSAGNGEAESGNILPK